MHTELTVLDYADGKTIRRSIYVLRLIPYFAVLFAIGAWRRSTQYHDLGQTPRDQASIALLIALSGAFLLASVALLIWHGSYTGKRRLITVLLCLGTVVFNAIAYWNACTAIRGQNDRLFF